MWRYAAAHFDLCTHVCHAADQVEVSPWLSGYWWVSQPLVPGGCRQAAATLWLGAGLVWLAAGYLFNVVAAFGTTVAAVLVVVPAFLMTIKPLRRTLLTGKAWACFVRSCRRCRH